MRHRFKLSVLLQGLTLLLLGPACEASSLGMTVHVEPLDSSEGRTVRAHFTAIASTPCPSLSELCADGEDCLVHTTSLPFNGTKPASGWCVRQWQKTVPSNYTGSISLGSDTQFYVSMNAQPKIRENSGRLNQPPFVGLPPPLRARVNCPHHFHLSVKDLDGDRVRCRFAEPEQGECLNCTRHAFIELDQEKCMLTFTGKASAGQYFIYLMAEDIIPAPKTSKIINQTPLSAVPVHLSLSVEEPTPRCFDEPVALSETPEEDSTLFVLPYQETKFNVHFTSELQRVLEIAVVGPPGLFRTGFKSVGPLSTMAMAWVRSENKLARLLPICFAANTESLQSEPRCVWLYQRQMRTLPAGTELTCEKTEMTLVLPIASLVNIDLDELQLNSPTCPVTYNSTHLYARISLTDCGTKIVHAGSELVYTNTLQSVRPYSTVSRLPSLTLPVACRIPSSQVKGPVYEVSVPTEKEVFGAFDFTVEVYLPGEGPMAKFTRSPKVRSLYRERRDAEPPSDSQISDKSTDPTTSSVSGAIGSKIDKLDLLVSSNTSVERAELIVSQCNQSNTEDFKESQPFLSQGCMMSNSTVEIVTAQTNAKVFRLDMGSLNIEGTTMYVRCTVNLCITTLPSDKCPELCSRSYNTRVLINSVFTKSYEVRSGPVSLVFTPAPTTVKTTSPLVTLIADTTTKPLTVTTTAAAAAATATTTSYAPEQASPMAAGVLLTAISVLLQNIFLQ